jgi:hypothetical protein
MPHLRDLSSDLVLSIRAVYLNFPYNFAQPPTEDFVWTLLDLLEHARFPTAALDVADKWDISSFSLDNFTTLIDPDRITEPGYLSTLSLAKLISYCLQIVESTAESMPTLAGVDAFTSEDLFSQIQLLANKLPLEPALSPWRQFWIATRQPTVRWAVNNAVMNRWGWRFGEAALQ